MLVMVKYVDGNFDMVVSNRLDGLIRSGKILEFRRSDGWARIGRDQTRRHARSFTGDERRRGEMMSSLL
jgi:hypothetical protein